MLTSPMDSDSADRAIVACTTALGRSLGLRVVAEGVESAASAGVLAAIGCDLAQGFHYSPPVPAGRVAELVRACERVGVVSLAPASESSSGLLGITARR